MDGARLVGVPEVRGPGRLVIGDLGATEQAIGVTAVDLKINCVEDPIDGDYSAGTLNLIDLDNIDIEKFEYGKVSAMCGKAAFESIEKSIDDVHDRDHNISHY